MKIESLQIDGIGGIKSLYLEFHEGLNVICGANGVGKTTILDIIADAFVYAGCNLKRNASFKKGKYSIFYKNAKEVSVKKNVEVCEFSPEKNDTRGNSSIESQYILLFSINRTINYNMLQAIPKDTSRSNVDSARQLISGVQISDLKGWFVNRYVFFDKNDSLSNEQKCNFELATKALSLLDPTVQFHTVDAGSLDIMLTTKHGEVYFEYLSAGYKSCFSLVLGLIKEIELRFKSPFIKAEDFNGVVLIDEIDLHLHPTWQGPLIQSLKQLFPKVQFIVTTHSPSILQTLKSEEIIALSCDENGDTVRKEFELGQYGLQGWTIEEILKYIMGMKIITSAEYESAIKRFDNAMNEEDIGRIKELYNILKEMLHPSNVLLKMFEIQIAGFEE